MSPNSVSLAISTSEDLFLRDPHVARDVGEHSGLHEITILKPGRMTFPADNEFRAFLDARLDVLTYKTEAEAIEIANDTEFGLIAYVSSADPERANRVARKLAAGRVLVNTICHDPFAPFGGFKQSGIGREGGIFGLQEYLEPKAIIS